MSIVFHSVPKLSCTTAWCLLQARADSEFAAEAGTDLADGEEDGQENKPAGPAWEGSDRDYSYEELLGM